MFGEAANVVNRKIEMKAKPSKVVDVAWGRLGSVACSTKVVMLTLEYHVIYYMYPKGAVFYDRAFRYCRGSTYNLHPDPINHGQGTLYHNEHTA